MNILMSCPNATSPINITKNTTSTCDLKCEYSFNYPTTNLQVSNRGTYLSFRTDPSREPPVVFNANKYDVSEFRLYGPSLHTYGGKRSEAELIIIHNNLSGSGNLLVCVPITIDKSITDASTLFDTIITQVAKTANSAGEQSTLNLPTFTLDKIVPKKPFYSYKGTLPYSPCNGSYNYVVFHKEDAISLTLSSLIKLTKIMSQQAYKIHEVKGGLFYNKNGPKIHKGISGDDDIYIECKPTGGDGEVIISKDTPLFGDTITKEMLNKTFGNKFMGVLIGVALMVGLIKVATIVVDKISGSTPPASKK
jgi:carbonic anhydrase